MRNNYLTIQAIITTLISIGIAHAKCLNSSDFKYDLKEPSDLLNYHSLCSEFSRRTCCSQNNFEQITKKLTKVMGGNVGLSSTCRFRLTNALCSFCDADIGEQLKEGTCSYYCRQLYQDCHNDYFSFDNNNQLRVCKQDDIICSKMSDIVSPEQKEAVCGLLELKIGDYNCWNGEVSGYLKGPAKNKIRAANKVRTKTANQKGLWYTIASYKHLLIPLGLVVLLAGIYLFRRSQRKYAMWKRQIRNL